MSAKLMTIAEIARTYLRAVENQKEKIRELKPKARRKRRSEILGSICWAQFRSAGIEPSPADIRDLKSRVGKYMSDAKKAKLEEKKKKAREERPFKKTPTRVLEAYRICHFDRRDDLLPDP